MNKLSLEISEAIKSVVTDSKLYLHEPIFDELEKNNLNDCIDSSFVSSVGQYVDKFEKMIAEFTNSKKVIALVNGTSALHLALKVLGINSNDEVICPSLTFVATANAISYLNAKPHFVDINEKTLGIDPLALEKWLDKIIIEKDGKSINKNTGRRIKAIIPMHTFGHPVEIDSIVEIANRYNLTVVEDAAESLGSFYRKKHTGTFGKVGILSFNGNKIITTGGGGALLTNDNKIAAYAKHLSTTAKVKHDWRFIHDQIGFNYRLPNLNAALGCAQMKKLPFFIESKRNLFIKYHEAFRNIKGVTLLSEPTNARSNYWLQTLILDEGYEHELEEILEYTNISGIMTRPAWELLHNLEIYKDCQKSPLPISETLSKRIINIPSSAFLVRDSSNL